jgi:hypothetical protein
MKRYNLRIIECTKDELIRHLKRTKSPLKTVPFGVYSINKKEIWVRDDLKERFTEVLIHEFVHFMQCNILSTDRINRGQSEDFAYAISRFYYKTMEQYRRKYNVYR